MRRRIVARTPRRKSDWGSAYITDAVSLVSLGTPIADIAGAWVKVASGKYDFDTDYHEEENDTLTRMIIDQWLQVRVDGIITRWSVYQGVIAWPTAYPDGTVVPTELPSPVSGAFPWVWRKFYGGVGQFGGGVSEIPTYFGHGPNMESDRQSMAQRKLPDSYGLLYVIQTIVETASVGAAITRWINADVRYMVKQA